MVIMMPDELKLYGLFGVIISESSRMSRMWIEPMQTIFAKKTPRMENKVTLSISAIPCQFERNVSKTAAPETKGMNAAMPGMMSRFEWAPKSVISRAAIDIPHTGKLI